jgi:hypothetical protein
MLLKRSVDLRQGNTAPLNIEALNPLELEEGRTQGETVGKIEFALQASFWMHYNKRVALQDLTAILTGAFPLEKPKSFLARPL